MIIRIPESAIDYFNFPLSLQKEAKVEKVQIASMNTNFSNNQSDDNMNKQESNHGFQEVLNTELKKYR